MVGAVTPGDDINDEAAPNRAEWDHGRAQEIIGLRVLIGITMVGPEGERLTQMFGIIVSAEPGKGIEVALEGVRDGETYWLPPDTAALHPAPLGDYRLKTTQEVVSDPDLLTTWTIRPPEN